MLNIYMDPILVRWGPLSVSWHGIWLAACIAAVYGVASREGRRQGIPTQYHAELMLWAALAGYVGARLLHVVDAWRDYVAHPADILAVNRGGLAAYGAVAGAALAIFAGAARRRLSFLRIADCVGPALPAAVIVGRVGCTIMGDVWGLPTGGRWGLVYWNPAASIPASLLGVPIFPAPIFEQALSALALLLLLGMQQRTYPAGALALVSLSLYAVTRLLSSVWQMPQPFLLGLSQAQILSLATLAIAVPLLVYLYRSRIALLRS